MGNRTLGVFFCSGLYELQFEWGVWHVCVCVCVGGGEKNSYRALRGNLKRLHNLVIDGGKY